MPDDRTRDHFSTEASSPDATGTSPNTVGDDRLLPVRDPLAVEQVPAGYELQGELGRGGMGVVYLAQQRGLNRLVALKVVLSGHRAGDVLRFLAEAEAVAAVKHPNVVQVYEYGEGNGFPYLAMEYLSGGSLSDKLKLCGRLSPNDAVELVLKVAMGVQAAHDQQIVHRDLKPGNILFDELEEPKVTDFGLAKRSGGSELTATGAILGTPAYMSPEQAGGSTKFVGPEADVWALGIILYETLLGKRPFVGATPLDFVTSILSGQFPTPRSVSADVPRDLELIVLKCLRREPRERYSNAGELADDLERFLQGEPITARAVPTWERWWKWARRHPAAAGLGAVSAVAVVALVGFVASRSAQLRLEDANSRLQVALTEADQLRSRLEEQQAQTREALIRVERVRYPGLLALAGQELEAQDLGRAEELLEECPDRLRGWEWSYLYARAHMPRTTSRKPVAPVLAIATHGTQVASGTQDGSIHIRDENVLHEPEVVIPGHKGAVRSVVFSSDGTLATTGDDGTIHLWEVTNEALAFRPAGSPLYRAKAGPKFPPSGPVSVLAFSPDAKYLAWVSANGTATLWERGAKEPRQLGQPGTSIQTLAFHPEGKLLATAGTNGKVELWTLTGELAFTLGPCRGQITALAWQLDGKQLAAAVSDSGQAGEIVMLDLTTKRSLRTLGGPPGGVVGLAYHPDGRLVATGRDASVRLWKPDGNINLILRRSGTVNTAPTISTDGKTIVVAGTGTDGKGEVTTWELASPPSNDTLPGHAGGTTGLSFIPESGRLVSCGNDGLIQVWDVATGRTVTTLRGQDGPVLDVAASPDLLWFASAGQDGTLCLWDVPTGEVAHRLKGHEGPVNSVAFGPDGTWLVSAGGAGKVIVWETTTGKPRWTLRGHEGTVHSVAVSVDGQRIASAGADRTVRIWNASDGKELLTCRAHSDGVMAVAFSHDGNHLASAGLDRTVRVWDVSGGKIVHTLTGHAAAVRGVTFSADDHRIASTGSDGTIKLWDIESGLEVFHLPVSSRGANKVAFDSRKRLTAASADGAIHIWQIDPSGERPPTPNPND